MIVSNSGRVHYTINTVNNKIYVGSSSNFSSSVPWTVSVIDGNTNAQDTVQTLTVNAQMLFVNPIDNRIFGLCGSGLSDPCTTPTMTVIDGSTNLTTILPPAMNSFPIFGTFDQAAGELFGLGLTGANFNGPATLVEFDQKTADVTQISLANPAQASNWTLAENPATNTAYVSIGNTLKKINGTTHAVVDMPVSGYPVIVATNPVTNTLYLEGSDGSKTILSEMNPATGAGRVLPVPRFAALNPVTNKLYGVDNSLQGNALYVLDLNTASVTNVTLPEIVSPPQVWVDQVRNKVYAVSPTATPTTIAIIEVDGMTNIPATITDVDLGTTNYAITLNANLQKLYCWSTAPGQQGIFSQTLRVVDLQAHSVKSALSNSTGEPFWNAPTIDASTNEAYLPIAPGTLYVVDGASDTGNFASVDGPGIPTIDPVTDTVYLGGQFALQPSTPFNVPVSVNVQGVKDAYFVPGLAIFGTRNASPSFTASVASTETPATAPMPALFYQMDSKQGTWLPATLTSAPGATTNTFQFKLSAVQPGVHTMFAFASNGGDPTGTSLEMSNIAAYTFIVYPTPAVMTSPAPGSTLTSTSTTFSWTAGTQVSQYSLYVGSTRGAHDVAYVNAGTQTSATVNLPNDGRELYVTLYSLIEGSYQASSYVYLAPGGTAAPATMTFPVSGADLKGASATFTWTTGYDATAYSLYVGTKAGAHDLDFVNTGLGTSASITNLPANNSTVYVTLYTLVNGKWQSNSYKYNSIP